MRNICIDHSQKKSSNFPPKSEEFFLLFFYLHVQKFELEEKESGDEQAERSQAEVCRGQR